MGNNLIRWTIFKYSCYYWALFQSLGIVEVHMDRLYNMQSGEANPDEHFTKKIAGCQSTPVVYFGLMLCNCFSIMSR